MATRSTISMEFPDGTFKQVYCHYDGYLDHNGAILAQHYTNADKIAELIALGDLSMLGPEIGSKRPFDNPHKYGTDAFNEFNELYRNQCLFYGRDRGETDIQARVFKSKQDFEDNCQHEEYDYVFRKGEWFVSDDSGRSWAKLSRVLEILAEQEEVF